MASNDDFELTEKYNDNDWAAFIHSNRFTDKLKEKTEKNAASHSSAIYLQDSSDTHEKNLERMDPMSYECSSAKLSIDDVHLFGLTPHLDDLILVTCWDCGKATKVQNLLSHIKDHHQSVEEYERKIDLSKEHAAFVASERQYMCSKKRKKEPQIVLDGLSEEKSKDVESQLNSFLSQNSPVSQLPIESENSVAPSSSYTEKKRKKGLPQSNRSKYNKRKTKVGYQSQENVLNLSNSVYSEQSTSSVNRTENVLFSYQTSPDSNHTVISGHSTALPGSTIYSSNHLKSIKQSSVRDFQSNDRGKDSSQRNYFSSSLLSSASVLSKSTTECSEQQSCTNSFESNDVIRTPSNQSFLQMSAKSLFPSTNQQDTENHFLSIGNKQPVKSPPRPRLETSISNNNKYESENSEPFLVVNKESSALSICSSSNSPAGDSLSKHTSIEDKAKNKAPIIHTPAVYCARLNMSINRIVQSPYVSVFRSDRSYRLKQALAKSITEENARIKEMKFKVATDMSRCGAESGYFSTSPKSASEPSPISELQSSTNFVSQPSPNFSLPPSPNSAPSEYLNSSIQQSVNSTSEMFQNSTSQSSPNYASEQSSSPPSSSVSQPSQNSLTRSPSIVCLIVDREGERECSRTNSDLTKGSVKLFKSYNVGGSVTTNYLSKGYVNLVNQTNNSGVKSTHRKYSNGCNNVVFYNRKNCENNINKTNKCGVKKKQHV